MTLSYENTKGAFYCIINVSSLPNIKLVKVKGASMSDQKIIIIRKGINGFSFAICNSEGNWIGNANSIHEIRKEYDYEIKHGIIKIKKETTILPTDAQMCELPTT